MYYNHYPVNQHQIPINTNSAIGYSINHNNSSDIGDRKILVTGIGIVTASPEVANIILGVITESPSLQTSQVENAERTANVIQALIQLHNIPEQNIQTSDFRIEMMYDYVEGYQTFRGYRVTHLLKLTLEHMDQVGVVVDTAIQSGANTVQSIQFSLKDTSTNYLRALELATLDGFTKARTIANSLRVTLNPTPLKIKEIRNHDPIIPYQKLMLETADTSTPIQPGTIREEAALEMTFTYY